MTFAAISALVWFMQDRDDWRGIQREGTASMSSPPFMGLLSAALI
jgi:hypothetical protein